MVIDIAKTYYHSEADIHQNRGSRMGKERCARIERQVGCRISNYSTRPKE
jgi:hypothetical protein